MNAGILFALVAAIGFAFLQASNRKSNQLIDAFRTSFGLLAAVEVMLVLRLLLSGDVRLILQAPLSSVVMFSLASFLHFSGGWTLLALSQQRIGVARTSALVAAAPVVGTLVAAIGLQEPLTAWILAGVLIAAAGVVRISMSGTDSGVTDWRRPWFALTVALIWGTTPWMIRLGLKHFDHPIEGLTIGMGASVLAYGAILAPAKVLRPETPLRAVRWIVFGGLSGSVALSAQWLSFDLTTIAIAITVQQLSVIFVIVLVPIMFREPFERMNTRFLTGAALVSIGTGFVVLA